MYQYLTHISSKSRPYFSRLNLVKKFKIFYILYCRLSDPPSPFLDGFEKETVIRWPKLFLKMTWDCWFLKVNTNPTIEQIRYSLSEWVVPPNSMLFDLTVPPNSALFGGTVPPHSVLFGGTVPPNSFPQKFTFLKATYLRPLISLRSSPVLEMNLLISSLKTQNHNFLAGSFRVLNLIWEILEAWDMLI